MKSLLANPRLYSAFQNLLGARGMNRELAAKHIRAAPGDVVLDIGCGPADILEFLPGVTYYGFDHNEKYINNARKRFNGKAGFRCEDVSAESLRGLSGFDIALANSVIHHLDDEAAQNLYRLAYDALVPGGRLVTIDCCNVEGQSVIEKFLNGNDRGKYVRTKIGYEKLARTAFNTVQSIIRSDLLRVPYAVIIIECVK